MFCLLLTNVNYWISIKTKKNEQIATLKYLR